MQKYLEDRGEVTFEKIFSQKLGELEGSPPSPTGLLSTLGRPSLSPGPRPPPRGTAGL